MPNRDVRIALKALVCLLAGGLLLGAGPVLGQQVEPAPEYENVFHRSSGWTGADGTYSYPLRDGRTLWGFSDTFFGDVVDGVRQLPCRFVHNSVVLQSGSSFDFPLAPVFRPPGDHGSWFWLFDGAEGDQILLGEFEGDGQDNGFGFRQIGLWVARFQPRPGGAGVKVSDLQRLPHFRSDDKEQIAFGPAILETPSWLYLYGALDREGVRNSVLARVPRGCLDQPRAWRFFAGDQWKKDISSVRPLFAGAAMEASVHLTSSGEYLYVGTDGGGMGSSIVARLAPTPEGPWGEPMLIFEAPEHKGDVFTYCAKAHPELSENGRLLLSYNVNTSNFEKLVGDADIYRPRFLWWTPPQPGWLPHGRRDHP
jgi:hypothetical protein